MKIAFISDLHIKSVGDTAHKTLNKFFENPLVKECTDIYLLGDIFDLLVGDHHEHILEYKEVFISICEQLDSGKNVFYIQGNHDFRFEKQLLSFIKKNSQYDKNFNFLVEGHIREIDGKRVYICHGDEVDFYNNAFKRWKRVYTSEGFNFFVSRVLSYKALKHIGDWASGNSKSRGSKTFDKELAKQKYIEGAKALISKMQVAGVVSGHTHIEEHKIYKDGTFYINNGFPARDKKFIISSKEKGFELVSI